MINKKQNPRSKEKQFTMSLPLGFWVKVKEKKVSPYLYKLKDAKKYIKQKEAYTNSNQLFNKV